jgi:MFS family permease
MAFGACRIFLQSAKSLTGQDFLALGAFLAPLVCQLLISHGISWRVFYLGSLILAALNTSFLIFAYHPTLAEFSYDRINASRETIKPRTPHDELPFQVDHHGSSAKFQMASPNSE